MNTYSDIIEEHQFHERVKRATREILARIEDGELKPVLEALKNHPFPKHIKFDEVVGQAVAQKDAVIFDAVMNYVAQHTLRVSLNKYIRYSMICACDHDFEHPLSCNPQWNAEHITPSLYLKLLQHSTQNNSSQCLRFVLDAPHTLTANQWMDLVGDAVTHTCPSTLDLLLSTSLDILEKHRLWVLSFLTGEHLKPLQHVMFDHFSLQDILLYTSLYRHDEVTQLYETHTAHRAEEQKQRIESQMISTNRSKERKL